LTFTPQTVKHLTSSIRFLWKAGFGSIEFYPLLFRRWTTEELWQVQIAFRAFSDFYVSLFQASRSQQKIFIIPFLYSLIKKPPVKKVAACKKINVDWNGNLNYCDKVFSLPEHARGEFTIQGPGNRANNRLRARFLQQQQNEIEKIIGRRCHRCRYASACFCLIGHYMYAVHHGLDFKEYFSILCRLSKTYIQSFLSIKRRLENSSLFIKIYN